MGIRVELSKIIDAMDFQSLEGSSYLDKTNGEAITLTAEEFQAAEDGDSLDDYPEWQHENIELARNVLSDDDGKRFLQLPTKFDIDEYRIMEKFCLSVQDEKTSEALYLTIKGSGAFRRFKDCVHQFGVAEDWYKYRDKTLKQIAIEWCEENGIAYVDDVKNGSKESVGQ